MDNNANLNIKPFKLTDRQNIIFERLNRLVGPSAASFYFDACEIMKSEPQFRATTNLVGFLLREIESSLRDVLESINNIKKEVDSCGPSDKQKKPSNHAEEIETILDALEFPKEHEVFNAWLSMPGSDGLQKYTHRDGLKKPRLVDDAFISIWNQMETILMAVLDKFEAKYNNVFKTLDELTAKEDPTAEDATRIRNNIPNNFVAHEYFFSRLSNSKWLPLLKKEGFFKETPSPEYDEENKGYRFPTWPQAVYLGKIASVESDGVADVLKGIEDADNATVKAQLLSVIANLSSEKNKELLEKVKLWSKADLQFFQSSLIDPAMKIVDKFIGLGEEDTAFDVAEIFLSIMPDQKINTDPSAKYIARLKPKMRLEEWQYRDFLDKHFKKLSSANPKKAFDLLCRVFSEYLELEYPEQGKDKYKDYCHISRPKIELARGRRDDHDIENILISAIRDAGIDIIESDSKMAPIIIKELDDRKWIVFGRIGIFLLGKALSASDALKNLASERLADFSLLDDSPVRNEQNYLLNKGFKLLDQDEKKLLVEWIEKAQYVTDRIAEIRKEKAVSDDVALKSKENWQKKILWYIKDDLSGDSKKYYEELIARNGEPKEELDLEYMSSAGPESEITSDDLLKMDIDDIINYLKNWQPKVDSFFGPTKAGLGAELVKAIKNKPDVFEGHVEKFKDLDPTYIRCCIDAFNELAKNGHKVNWSELLDFCLNVVKKPKEIPGRIGHVSNQDPDWSWTRQSTVHMISHGLNNNSIPYALRKEAWSILEILMADPEPTPERENEWQKSSDDFYSLAINTIRGEAMGAVFEYSLWVYREMSKIPEEKEKLNEGFGVMPEVRIALENHLKNDPSAAVRSTYGHFFPWLLLIDKKWTLENLESIFPSGKFTDILYGAAWDTLMLFVPPYDEPFEILKEKYKEAVQNIGRVDEKKSRFETRDEKLAEHLMVFYFRGKIKLDEELLTSFWEIADDSLRGHALGFVGRVLKNDDGKTTPDIIDKLKTLWEHRIKIAKAEKDKKNFKEEMSAFEWWFNSESFDDEWSMDQFLDALDIAENDRSDYLIFERLIKLTDKYPVKAVKILGKLVITKSRNNWTLLGNKGEVSSVLSKAIAVDGEAKKEAEEIINRLASKGLSEFNNLLKKE